MNTPLNETDWNLELIQPVSLEVTTWACEQAQKTPVITLPIRVKPARVHSYFFTPESKQENGEDSFAKAFLAAD